MTEHNRCAGFLLPVFSLPGPWGIGRLGAEARRFCDFLARSGQSIWQVLPLGPTGFGNSPYQSFSSFAGNPYLIDPRELGLSPDTLETLSAGLDFGAEPGRVDYGKLYENNPVLLRRIYTHLQARGTLEDTAAFEAEQRFWLPDYALFTALKRHFDMRPWYDWPEDIRAREPAAMDRCRAALQEEIRFEIWVQQQFFRQFEVLKAHCTGLGIRLMGDIPFYTAPDSADVWAHPEQFLLDDQFRPVEVAGVPPDYFSRTGQLWGNPLYRWEQMRSEGYAWWRERLGAAARMYDLVRLDHFRAFESYWSVPYGSETAENGRWNPGPGRAFLKILREDFPDTEFVAEDLGIITDAVRALRQEAGLPGMAVLSFAFDGEGDSPHLPHNLERGCVCYTGTHDNAPVLELAALGSRVTDYCGGASDDEGFCRSVIRSGMVSPAGIFIAQLQDWLALGSEARINTPGADRGCWEWRMTALPGSGLEDDIFAMTYAARRCKRRDEKGGTPL